MAGPGRRGPAPIPTEAKRRRGNPGHQHLPTPLIALAPLDTRKLADADTSPGAQLIRDILATPAATWLAETDRLGILRLLSEAWNEWTALKIDIATNGYGDGRYTRPAVLRLDRVERNLTSWLSLSGLTPVDRSRLGVAEVKAQTHLESLRAKRQSRAG